MKLRDNNNNVIILIKNRQVSEKLKYINIIYYYIRDFQKYRRVNVNYILINIIIVNNFIKPLVKQKFHKFLKFIDMKATE